MRILIVTSDPALMRLAALSLADAGFEVAQAYDAEEGLRQAQQNDQDAIVIDLYLRGGESGALCRQVRGTTDAPMLTLTELAHDGYVDDGLEDGADDYLIKPFTGPVLVARVRSLVRRAARHGRYGHLLQVRDLTIDQQRLQVSVSGRQTNLTPTEFRLLSCMARNAGRVMTCRELLKGAQGYECEEQEAQEIVKVHVNHLRQKIEPDQSNPCYIVNVRGFGYMLERRAHPC